jgi:hypothetical protein
LRPFARLLAASEPYKVRLPRPVGAAPLMAR